MTNHTFTVNLRYGRINAIKSIITTEDEAVVQTIIDQFLRYRLTSIKYEEDGDYLVFFFRLFFIID